MIYCYACDKCGNKLSVSRPMAESGKRKMCPKCKKRMSRDIGAECCKTQLPSNWPMESDAAGVHPDQAKEYSDYLRAKGVPTEVRPNGNPVFTSQHHRARVCRATNMYDRNAGYGDAAPKHNMRKRKTG